jgi:CRP-like cAMP-binding protein
MSSGSVFFEYPGKEQPTPSVERQLLPHWTDRQWDTLLQFTETIRFRKNQLVVRAGDADRSLMIVSDGTLDALVPVGLAKQRFSLRPGSLIGEIAFFDGQPRSVDVVAASDGELLRLDPAGFEEFAARHPGLARDLLLDLGHILASRLRRTQQLAPQMTPRR